MCVSVLCSCGQKAAGAGTGATHSKESSHVSDLGRVKQVSRASRPLRHVCGLLVSVASLCGLAVSEGSWAQVAAVDSRASILQGTGRNPVWLCLIIGHDLWMQLQRPARLKGREEIHQRFHGMASWSLCEFKMN